MPVSVCSEASGFVFEHARDAQRWSPCQPALARILITLLYAAIGTLQGSGTFESPPPCAAWRGWLGQPAPCSPPADVCIDNHIVSTQTSPSTAALSRQGGILLTGKGRGGAGAGRCGDAPKGSRTSSGTGLLCRAGACRPLSVARDAKAQAQVCFSLAVQPFVKLRFSSCLG